MTEARTAGPLATTTVFLGVKHHARPNQSVGWPPNPVQGNGQILNFRGATQPLINQTGPIGPRFPHPLFPRGPLLFLNFGAPGPHSNAQFFHLASGLKQCCCAAWAKKGSSLRAEDGFGDLNVSSKTRTLAIFAQV